MPAFQAIVTLNLSNVNNQKLEFPKLTLNVETYADAYYYYNRHSNESAYVALTDKYGQVVGQNGELVGVSDFATSNFTSFIIFFTGVSHIKLKKPQQLQEVLDVSRQLLEQIESGSSESELIEEKKSKLEQVRNGTIVIVRMVISKSPPRF